MNKVEKLICLALGAVLAWWIWSEMGRSKERARLAAEQAAVVATNDVEKTEAPREDATFLSREKKESAASQPDVALPSVPEKIVTLENADVRLELSTWGAVVKKVTLKKYAKNCGEISDENPAVEMDFSDSPMGAIGGIEGLAANAAYEVRSQSSNGGVLAKARGGRRVTLRAD